MYSTNPILLLEDDTIDQQAVRKAFKELNIKNQLVICENGEKGIHYLENFSKPSLILLDLNMPRMNGFEFLEYVKKDKSYKIIPIIVFTTSNEESEMRRAYEQGVVGFIVKPRDYHKFSHIFHSIINYWTVSEAPRI